MMDVVLAPVFGRAADLAAVSVRERGRLPAGDSSRGRTRSDHCPRAGGPQSLDGLLGKTSTRAGSLEVGRRQVERLQPQVLTREPAQFLETGQPAA